MDPQNVEKLYFLQKFLFESDNPNTRIAASNYLKASLLLTAESSNLESTFSHRLNAQQIEQECRSQYRKLMMQKSEGGIFSTVDMKMKAVLEKKRKKDENFESCLKNAQSGMSLENLLSMTCSVDVTQRPSLNFAALKTDNPQGTGSLVENSQFQKDIEVCRAVLTRIFPRKNGNLEEFTMPGLEKSKIYTISRETQTTDPYHCAPDITNRTIEEIDIDNKLDTNEFPVEEKNGNDSKNGFVTARTLSVQQKGIQSSKKRPQLPLQPSQPSQSSQPPTKRQKFITPRTTSESLDDDMSTPYNLNVGTNAGKNTSKRTAKSATYTMGHTTGGFMGNVSNGNGLTGEDGSEVDERLRNLDPKMIEMIHNEIMSTPLSMTWDSIAGLEHAKETIQEAITYPMLRPDIFTGLRSPPRGLLLFGPPGTGKTLIAKCIASQSKATFFSISASALTSKWVGDGEKMVRTLFGVARCCQPAIIFFDEIDSILTQRTDGENEASRKIKTEFLVQFDGCGTTAEEDRILIIGATNRPHEIDEAVRRRFRKRLYIPLPSHEARLGIIKNLIKCQTHSLTEEDIEKICSATNGYSGSDMDGLCREAALGPIRSLPKGSIANIDVKDVRPININDFESALTQVRASVAEKDLGAYLKFNQEYGSLN